MDLLTHILSGVAAGTVVAGFSSKSRRNKVATVAFGGFGGMFPDFDVISLWSGFDATFGRMFNLKHTGREIFSLQLWYSHHGFLHSVIGSLVIATVIWLTIYLLRNRFKNLSLKGFGKSVLKHKEILLAFIAGFIIHTIEDMPTPSGGWEGVNFLWPSKIYTGGTGDIWWWNNYDIFLFVVGVIFVNSLLLFSNKLFKTNLKKVTLLVFAADVFLGTYQVKTRGFDFNYAKGKVCEIKSKEIQKEILGQRVYSIMEALDKKVRIPF
jgi:membrane-bound metal-dependent hydrolase YbcI (DUF457 family)